MYEFYFRFILGYGRGDSDDMFIFGNIVIRRCLNLCVFIIGSFVGSIIVSLKII